MVGAGAESAAVDGNVDLTPAPERCTTEIAEAVVNEYRCDVRPRQDSNLRTRLRRAMLYPLSYEGRPEPLFGSDVSPRESA